MHQFILLVLTLFLANLHNVFAVPTYSWQSASIFSWSAPNVARQSFYDRGSCGLSTYHTDKVSATSHIPLVAMPISIMQNNGFAQHNTLCGRRIKIVGSNGRVRHAVIADTNMTVEDNSIDMTSDLWQVFGGKMGDGSLLRVRWRFA